MTHAKGHTGHAAHRTTNNRMDYVDAEILHDLPRGFGDVLERKHREAHAIDLAGFGIDRRGSRGTEAAAERVHANDEVAIGVDRVFAADHILPPARRRILDAGRHVGGRRQAREDQDGIISRLVELAPGFVGEGRRFEVARTVHAKVALVGHVFSRSVHRPSYFLTRFISRARLRSWRGVSLLRRPLYGLSLVLKVSRTGVPLSLNALRKRLTR